jgi:hypothetical protein
MFFLHSAGGSVLEEFIEIATDPAHLLFELAFSVIFDILIVSVIWGFIIKKIIIPRVKRDVHREIDEEHGVAEHD